MKLLSIFSLQWEKRVFFCLIFPLLISTCAEALPPGLINLSWPINRSVIQRNSSNQANVFFAGQFQPLDGDPTCPSYDYYYQVENLNLSSGLYSSTQISWTQFTLQGNPSGVFSFYRNLPVGWYDIKVKATTGGVSGSQVAYTSARFGVGDVYVIAGQSNAQGLGIDQNFSTADLPSITPYDCVSVHSYDGNCQSETDLVPNMQKLLNNAQFRIGPNGHSSWNWAALGRLFAINEEVPTAFFNAAAGGSTVKNWRESISGGTNSVYGGAQYCSVYKGMTVANPIGQPYLTLKNVLKYYAKVFGVKAVLWHQGEADKYAGTLEADYKSDLLQVIAQSRTDFGSSNLTWFISRASYDMGGVSQDVIRGQNGVISANTSYNKNGPITDNITNRVTSDNTHIWRTGLDTLASRWRDAINANSSQAFSPQNTPTASIVSPSPYYAQVNSSYAEYKWSNNSRSFPLSSSQLADVNARCFVKDFSGNWLLTPHYLSDYFCTGMLRIGVEETTAEESDYNFMISANPVVDQSSNITFNLAKEQNVRLEIMDEKGVIVKKIADGPHAAGQYTYPVWMQNRAAGMYICVLQADGLGMTKRFMLAK